MGKIHAVQLQSIVITKSKMTKKMQCISLAPTSMEREMYCKVAFQLRTLPVKDKLIISPRSGDFFPIIL